MTRKTCFWLGLVGGSALLVLACGKTSDNHAAGAGGGSPSTGAEPSVEAPPASGTASVAPPPPARDPTCRALRVEGEAKVGDVPLASGTELDGSDWVTLGKGASLTLKHAASGRELGLAGPARFRACRRGREQLLLAEGQVTVGSGMGARPGAEVTIATPVGAVRYADADLSLKLDDKRLSVEVRAGTVEIDSATPGAAPGKGPKSPLHAKDKLVVPLGKPDVALLLSRCQAAAEAAAETARKVADKSAAEPLGERAQAHVRARKAARAACTIAAAATGLVADPTAAAGFWAEAARWEGLWETIPRPGRAQAPEK
jgi:hypothetical protein